MADYNPEEADIDKKAWPYWVRRLVDEGLKLRANELWTYEQIGEIIEDPNVHGSTSALQEALRRLSRDHGVEFKNVRKVGYVRLDDSGIADRAPHDRRAVGRRIKRAQQRSSNIKDWDALSDERKRETDAHRSILNLIRMAVSPASVRRVRHEVTRVNDELDPEKLIELFQRPGKRKR